MLLYGWKTNFPKRTGKDKGLTSEKSASGFSKDICMNRVFLQPCVLTLSICLTKQLLLQVVDFYATS